MEESVKTEVRTGKNLVETKKLEIAYEEGVLVFKLEDSSLFCGEFTHNLEDVFARCLELWSSKFEICEFEEEEDGED